MVRYTKEGCKRTKEDRFRTIDRTSKYEKSNPDVMTLKKLADSLTKQKMLDLVILVFPFNNSYS